MVDDEAALQRARAVVDFDAETTQCPACGHTFAPQGVTVDKLLRAVIGANPTEYVLQAVRDLMLTGYDWQAIGLAFLVIVGLGLVGLPLTLRNYRSIIQ